MDAFKFGTGLVEVSAVATLIGASVAQKLAMGEKAAAGFPWASMSAFGVMHVVKACLSASFPDWVREALGMRNEEVDGAVGVCAVVNNRRQARRADLGDACAIRMPHDDGRQENRLLPFRSPTAVKGSEAKVTVFYAMDRTAKLILNSISSSKSGKSLLIHEYVPPGVSSRFRDCVDGEIPVFVDNVALFASCAKIVEVVVLWILGAHVLWWATAIGWVVAFPGAVTVQSLGVSRDHLSRPRTDLLAGTLPSHAIEGGQGTLILGLPENVRRHTIWRIVWAFTAIANLASLVAVFLCLGNQPAPVVYAWIGFQTTWLLSRSVVYRVLEGASACQGDVRTKPWDEASISSRQRAVQLLLGLSRQQITLHPRGTRAYLHDTLSAPLIVSLFESVHWTITETITLPARTPASGSAEERIAVIDVIGDTVMRSVAWAQSAGLSQSDLYDSALVFLRVDKVIRAVPAMRVYSCNCVQTPGRGNVHPNECTLIEWVIFIPHQTGWWHVHGPQTKGNMLAERLDDAELHKRLEGAKMWTISIRSVEEVRAVLAVSRTAAALLRDMARSTRL